MGRMMMRASSPEDEIERPETNIFRMPPSPETITEFKFESWPQRSSPVPPSVSTFQSQPASIQEQSQASNTASSPRVLKPNNSTYRVVKGTHRHRSQYSHPSMRIHSRFTTENFSKALELAVENQETIEEERRRDLMQGWKRSQGYWLNRRVVEEQPNEEFRRLRRLQFESEKREMVDMGLKDWEISNMCLEGESCLRKEISDGEME